MNIHPVATKDIRACGAPERMEASRLHAQLPFSRKTDSRRRAIRDLISICMSFIRFESRTCLRAPTRATRFKPQYAAKQPDLRRCALVSMSLPSCMYLFAFLSSCNLSWSPPTHPPVPVPDPRSRVNDPVHSHPAQQSSPTY